MDIQQILPAPMPSNVAVSNHGTELTLSDRWYSPKFIFVIFFYVVWDGFLFVRYSQALSTNAPLVMILFHLFYVGVGAGLTCCALAGFLNRTVVEVSHEGLTMYHTPLRWSANKTIPVSDLAQLYREEGISRGNRSTRVAYQLSAASKESKKMKLLHGIETVDVALSLEQEIEKWLGIKDIKIAAKMQKLNTQLMMTNIPSKRHYYAPPSHHNYSLHRLFDP